MLNEKNNDSDGEFFIDSPFLMMSINCATSITDKGLFVPIERCCSNLYAALLIVLLIITKRFNFKS